MKETLTPEQIVDNLQVARRVTSSLQRCVEFAKRDPTGSRNGLIRALKAARERIVSGRKDKLGPATRRYLRIADQRVEIQRYSRPDEAPDFGPDSPTIRAVAEVEGGMVEAINAEGKLGRVRATATLIQDESDWSSRFIAGRPEKLGLSQLKRINLDLFRHAQATLASEAKRIKARGRKKS